MQSASALVGTPKFMMVLANYVGCPGVDFVAQTATFCVVSATCFGTCWLFPTCRLTVVLWHEIQLKHTQFVLYTWLNWSDTLMTHSHCWRCSDTLYICKEDLLWVWTGWGVSILSSNRGSKCKSMLNVTLVGPWELISGWSYELHPYDP